MAMFNILLAIHVLSVVWWIGGVFTVTASLLPIFNRLPAPERIQRIKQFEGRFINQARIAVVLAGISGFWMLEVKYGFAYLHQGGWWIGLMMLVWALFVVMLFIAEPLRLPAVSSQPNSTLPRMRDPAATVNEAALSSPVW